MVMSGDCCRSAGLKKGDGCAVGGSRQDCLRSGFGFFCFLGVWWLHLCLFLFLFLAVVATVVIGKADFVEVAVSIG